MGIRENPLKNEKKKEIVQCALYPSTLELRRRLYRLSGMYHSKYRRNTRELCTSHEQDVTSFSLSLSPECEYYPFRETK